MFGPDGFPAHGRHSIPWDDAEALLVSAPEFSGSITRSRLWGGLEDYLARFVAVEELHSSHLGGAHLVDRVWLGGSFASSKVDPENVDLSVLLDRDAADKILGRPGTGWLKRAFHRERMRQELGLSPLPIPYRRVASPFRFETLTLEQREYYEQRGAWDDWWQRCRTSEVDRSPTLESAVPARGYLEVVL